MARYTQNDLRKMYEAPPQELTEQIHESISLLPLREQEERSMKMFTLMMLLSAASGTITNQQKIRSLLATNVTYL